VTSPAFAARKPMSPNESTGKFDNNDESELRSAVVASQSTSCGLRLNLAIH
jgi:hypothetical protein